jgi:hypothetical protein
MTHLLAIRDRLQGASGTAAFLDTAYEAFDVMLAAIEDHQHPGSELFTQLVYAATCAADGRDAILAAPSLPLRPIHREDTAGMDGSGTVGDPEDLVALSKALSRLLAHAAGTMPGDGDRAACQAASRQAATIHRLLTGATP